jgi:16S rRNA (adenine1518-N6/adenine1519-N6)-dimethyltransferase
MPLIPVPPTSFDPAPKVQSAVVRLTPYSELPHKADNIKLLGQIVSLCFQQRRKTLKNCLNNFTEFLSLNPMMVDLTKRPEQLSVEEFVTLSNCINNNMVQSDE